MAGNPFLEKLSSLGGSDAAGTLSFPELKTPVFVVSEKALVENGKILKEVQEKADCKILWALKCFAMPRACECLKPYLSGTCASGLFEARMGNENFGGETHVYAPAFSDDDMRKIVGLADHITFNSYSQLRHHKKAVENSGRNIKLGLRVNPGYSEVKTMIYNPCAPYSRFGVHAEEMEKQGIKEISGLHFHTMCEQKSDVLERTLEVVGLKFGKFLKDLEWANLGGGQIITRFDYDRDHLIRLLKEFKTAHGLKTLYMEPGEAIALDSGVLVASVLDIIENGMPIAIVDASAANHMPDVLEMPYRPEILSAGLPGEKPYTYRLGAPTCLAGDYIGDYSFDHELKPGDRLIFMDMAIYSFVKTCMFNGIDLPSLAFHTIDGKTELVREFTYEDYASRLGAKL